MTISSFAFFFSFFFNLFDDNSSNDQKNPVGLYWVNIIYIAQIREVFLGKCLHIVSFIA